MDKYEYQKRLIEKEQERTDEILRRTWIKGAIIGTIFLILILLKNHGII